MSTIKKRLSSRVGADGKSEIMLRFSGGRDAVFRLRSGIRVPPARWKDGKIIIPRVAADREALMRTERELEDLCRHIADAWEKSDKASVTRAWFDDVIDRYRFPEKYAAPDIRFPFFETLDRYITTARISENRKKNFRVLARLLRRFELFSGTALTFEGVTPETLSAFREFMKEEHRKPEPRGQNTLAEKFEKLRAFWFWAIREEITENNPFRRFEMDVELYGTPYYITTAERDQIARTNLRRHPELAAQRDIFVFQCFVGCRVSDLVKLQKSSIIRGALEYIPRKTKDERPVVVRVPLTASAREIVARYADLPGDQLLPFISPQKYNQAIKRIFTAARLTRLVTVLDPLTREEVRRPLNEIASSHLARRTFVGNLYKKVKDPNLVGSMSGHAEGSRAFTRYREIDDQMKADVVNLSCYSSLVFPASIARTPSRAR